MDNLICDVIELGNFDVAFNSALCSIHESYAQQNSTVYEDLQDVRVGVHPRVASNSYNVNYELENHRPHGRVLSSILSIRHIHLHTKHVPPNFYLVLQLYLDLGVFKIKLIAGIILTCAIIIELK